MVPLFEMEVGRRLQWFNKSGKVETELYIMDIIALGKSYSSGNDVPSDLVQFVVIIHRDGRLPLKDAIQADDIVPHRSF